MPFSVFILDRQVIFLTNPYYYLVIDDGKKDYLFF